MNDKPNFWSITPAYVRYHEDLSDFAKLVYSEIMALSNKNGYCHANNNYFEKVFNKSQPPVSKALTDLEGCGLIKMSKRDGSETRKITPLVNSDYTSPKQDLLGEVKETFLHNNTSNNNTSIDTKVSTEQVKVLPLSGKSSLLRLVNLYSLLWSKKYGTRPTINFPRAGKALKSLVDSHGEYKVALILVQYFSWRGATGADEFLVKRLESNTYPLYWITDQADPILAYLRNVLKIDVDATEKVEKIVDAKIADTVR